MCDWGWELFNHFLLWCATYNNISNKTIVLQRQNIQEEENIIGQLLFSAKHEKDYGYNAWDVDEEETPTKNFNGLKEDVLYRRGNGIHLTEEEHKKRKYIREAPLQRPSFPTNTWPDPTPPLVVVQSSISSQICWQQMDRVSAQWKAQCTYRLSMFHSRFQSRV